jgi:ribonuclease HI
MDGPIVINFDGGSRGNPGIAGVGVVLSAMDGTPLLTLGRYIGTATNNVAEYQAVILGLQKALELEVSQVIVRGDSELIIKQLGGVYRVKQPHLIPLWEKAKSLLAKFKSAKLEHNRRHHNTVADKLANLAMDLRGDVTDDEMPGGADSASAVPASRSDDPPAIGDEFACRRCGTVVELIQPAKAPAAELREFICQCGTKMQRRV